ncbi:Transmembrane protein 218 [Merluccius polli]|uniref:Transmembrane protein 218 n=1 Tax=Merluccius polli TaxID=89951 RepID=A0AA47NCK4_MERPO|nr:Transmembrane protein 218 [Merluccius polli]
MMACRHTQLAEVKRHGHGHGHAACLRNNQPVAIVPHAGEDASAPQSQPTTIAMADVVLGVGTGVFLVVVIWILALIFGIILLRASGPIKLGVVPVFLVALIITLVLVFFPRMSETIPPFKEAEIVDQLFIGRYVLLSVASVAFLAGLFMLLPHHLLEPVYAKPLRSR